MDTNKDPKDLAIELLDRSQCSVQVAAIITDSEGVISWGWNSMGPTGYGQHAEDHALWRSNPKRLEGSTITVAGRRAKSGNFVLARPCAYCMETLRNVGIDKVVYRTKYSSEDWEVEFL